MGIFGAYKSLILDHVQIALMVDHSRSILWTLLIVPIQRVRNNWRSVRLCIGRLEATSLTCRWQFARILRRHCLTTDPQSEVSLLSLSRHPCRFRKARRWLIRCTSPIRRQSQTPTSSTCPALRSHHQFRPRQVAQSMVDRRNGWTALVAYPRIVTPSWKICSFDGSAVSFTVLFFRSSWMPGTLAIR